MTYFFMVGDGEFGLVGSDSGDITFIMGHGNSRELLFQQFVAQINSECSQLCQHQPKSFVYRKMP